MKHSVRKMVAKHMVVFIIILFALRMLSGSAQTDLSNQRSIAPECRQLLAHLEKLPGSARRKGGGPGPLMTKDKGANDQGKG